MQIVIRPTFIIALIGWGRCWGEVNNIFRWCDSRRICDSLLEQELCRIWRLQLGREFRVEHLAGGFDAYYR
jgi:hypothetical protein